MDPFEIICYPDLSQNYLDIAHDTLCYYVTLKKRKFEPHLWPYVLLWRLVVLRNIEIFLSRFRPDTSTPVSMYITRQLWTFKFFCNFKISMKTWVLSMTHCLMLVTILSSIFKIYKRIASLQQGHDTIDGNRLTDWLTDGRTV